MSLCCEQQRKGLQTHNNPPKERVDVDAQLFCYVSYIHNSKTKSYYSMKLKLFNEVDYNVHLNA